MNNLNKKFIVFIATVLCSISTFGATPHYKLAVENPEIPGDSIYYDILEPSALDYRTHFIAEFIKETHKNKFNSLYYNGGRNGFLKVVFLLDKDGVIKDTQIIEKSGSSYEYKLVDIFNSADPISPGYINGKPAMFMGQFEIKDGELDTIRVYWTPLIGTVTDPNFNKSEKAEKR